MRRWLLACDAWLFGGPWQRLSFGLSLLVFGAIAWAMLLKDGADELDAERDKQPQLQQDYHNKLGQAVNLPAMREHRRTLPDKPLPDEPKVAFVDVSLLANDLGLQIEQMQAVEGETAAGAWMVRSARARFRGDYRQFARFAEAVSASGQPFALRNLGWEVTPAVTGLLLEATIDINRRMTADELAADQKAKAKAKEKAKEVNR